MFEELFQDINSEFANLSSICLKVNLIQLIKCEQLM